MSEFYRIEGDLANKITIKTIKAWEIHARLQRTILTRETPSSKDIDDLGEALAIMSGVLQSITPQLDRVLDNYLKSNR